LSWYKELLINKTIPIFQKWTEEFSKFDDCLEWLKIQKSLPELNGGRDMVNHPPHYKSETGLEVIDVIEAFTFDLKGIEATDTGNIIKYICRWKNKNGIEDLKKARWYLNHLITHIEKLEQEDI
jgi:hypothetical protein